MSDLKKRMKDYFDKLENDPDFEMSEEMQTEYYELKELIDMYEEYDLEIKFDKLHEDYDNPNSHEKRILKDMFPDTDGEFNIDDFWKD